MNITFLSFFSGHVSRGAENFVQELASRLAINNKVTLIQSGQKVFNNNFTTIVVPFDIETKTKDQSLTLPRRFFIDSWSRLIGKFALQAVTKINSADVIIPLDGGWEAIITRFWAWNHKAKVVITGHSGIGWYDRINLLTRPDAFVALSDYQNSWAKRNGFGVKVVKIPNGIDLQKFNPKTEPVALNLQKPIVLCNGALEPNKRIELLIKAVAKLKNTSLLILGDGPSRAQLIQIGKKFLGRNFLQINVPYQEVPGYYTAADVFSLPTVPWEPFGIVYLEALASNIPVVAPDDPIRREIIGNSGIFVDPTKTDSYAHVLKNALAHNWGQVPRKQAKKFSWEIIANQYKTLFSSLSLTGTVS